MRSNARVFLIPSKDWTSSSVLRDMVEHLLHLCGHWRSPLRRGDRHCVHIGKHHLEGVVCRLNDRLDGAVLIELVYPADAGAVALNQMQAVEHPSKIPVARLGDPDADIVGGKAGEETADGDELHPLVIHIDDNAAAEAVIAVHQCIHKHLAEGFLGIIPLLNTLQALKHRLSFVAEHQIIEGILQLRENRASELLIIPEGSVAVVPKDTATFVA